MSRCSLSCLSATVSEDSLVDSDVAEPTLLLFVHDQFLRTGGVVDRDLLEPILLFFVHLFQNSAFVAYRMS